MNGFPARLGQRLLNLLLYLLFCLLAGTGFLLANRLPRGRAGHQLQFLGEGRHTWAEIHTWLSYAFLILVLLHLAQHWKWLVKVAGRSRYLLLACGLLMGIAIVMFFLLAPLQSG